ncbi:hypothetical protein [Nocardia carnea]|uniref:hypothetical protein n=1 Tax=Nocardia carnea TaxID=37328 RepID=UPI0024552698|nr:hypothetical protein [Nocardia carnea]
MKRGKRTVVLCRPDTPCREIQYLQHRYNLDVVYTVFTDTESSKLAALIAGQHIADHGAEVLLIPYVTAARIAHDQHWRTLLATAGIIAFDGPVAYSPAGPGR